MSEALNWDLGKHLSIYDEVPYPDLEILTPNQMLSIQDLTQLFVNYEITEEFFRENLRHLVNNDEQYNRILSNLNIRI